MKIITDPTVRLVGRQSIDESELAAFLADEGVESWKTDTEIGAQKLVEVAGRLCYKSYAKPRPGGNAAYLSHILEVGHGSVIEHAVYNFIITGVSRSFTHELVRHRAGFAYSQRSQRFCDESESSFVEPPLINSVRNWIIGYTQGSGCSIIDILKSPEDHAAHVVDAARVVYHWHKAVSEAASDYAEISHALTRIFQSGSILDPPEDKTLCRKQAREAARSVLPNATETQIFVTANARALRHFVEMRGDEHADAEIRRVAVAILRILRVESPDLFGDYELDPFGSVFTKHRKV